MDQRVADALPEVTRLILLISGAPRSWRTTLPPSGSGSSVSFLPPDAQVHDQVQPAVLKGELALVDHQAGVDIAVRDGVVDLVEREDDGLEVSARSSRSARNALVRCRGWRSRAPAMSSTRHRPAGDDPRAVAVAHAAPCGRSAYVDRAGRRRRECRRP